ncbi:unnamed protein product [Cyprideis torosa]|uniref:Uncharacterized protein n=1 Tax=Cyprideis torosa TaxID=163714 RepID=A0A7R8W891_9CRUS|nr:unnamed protein product [Cyprideis torosa]CAG0888345.1 unnamed protein product [Cyprideis torosa]
MRLLIAVIVFVGAASAWPNFFDGVQNQRTSAGVSREELLDRQVKVLTLLERIHEPSNDPVVSSTAKSFNPAENPLLYTSQGSEMFRSLSDAKTFDTFFKTASWARERLNEGLFVYAFITSALHRPDLKGVKFPAPYEINPHFFVPTEVIQEAYRAQMKQTPKTIASGFTGTAKNVEQRVAYFGEDVGLESHHYHWHMDFPFWWDAGKFGAKDRKGELFFYMHHQLNARFDAERLSNNLPRVKPIGWNERLAEGFAPHATYLREGEFPARPDNMKFRDLPEITLGEMDRFTDRIREAVDKLVAEGYNGNMMSLNNSAGINVLGAMIEASTESPNSLYYGSIHNFCHMLLSRIADPDGKYGVSVCGIEDPDGKYGLPPGVMEHFETSTRDPTFFRLHKFLDEIFREYKNNLGPYPRNEARNYGYLILGRGGAKGKGKEQRILIFLNKQVNFQGVEVQALKVTSSGKSQTPNTLITFFDDFEFDLNNALDHIQGKEDVEIKTVIKRLNNEPFMYNIEVRSDANRMATVRIFLAPKYEQYGAEISLDEKRWEMIELDKFTAKLAAGSNTITRNSLDSSVTIPDQIGLKQMKQQALDAINGDSTFQIDEDYRHCGLPDRLLIPKGTSHGMEFELWVVLSDWEEDRVDSTASFETGGSISYCGESNFKYPDKRAMGFPWDRPIPDLDSFVTPNFKSVDIKIKHIGMV